MCHFSHLVNVGSVISRPLSSLSFPLATASVVGAIVKLTTGFFFPTLELAFCGRWRDETFARP